MSSSFMLDGGFYSVCVSSGMLSKENNLLISAFLQRALFIEGFFFFFKSSLFHCGACAKLI